jgi:hypothetical protein
MKKIIFLLSLSAGFNLSGQTLSNPGFENWSSVTTYTTDTIPNQWYAMYCNTVHQTADAYQGSYATRIQGYFACGIAPGILINGQQPAGYGNIIEGGTPFSTKPATINGFYKYTEVTNNDSAEVTVILKKYNAVAMKYDTVGLGIAPLAAAAAYSPFSVAINYLLPSETPDSIIIMFNSSKYYHFDMVTGALPSLYIDRILLPQETAGIEESGQVIHSVVYPNPSAGTITLHIEGDEWKQQDTELSIFDAAGKMVRMEKISHNEQVINGLPKGNYMYTLSVESEILSKGKIIVQ